MSDTPFHYQDPFPLGEDTTEYDHVSSDHVSISEFEGQEILKIRPEALAMLANEAVKAISFKLRTSHLKQVASILDDSEATDNDRMVALMLLKNAEIAAHGILPGCQDTGTAIVMGKRGQQVLTEGPDEAALSHGIFDAYQTLNLRYSQLAPLTMWDERNTGTNLPAQVEIYADTEPGHELAYKFLVMTKGGGSANKWFLFQETKALL
ncbi:MAG: fumarate hydratase, partial [Akkermansiaceae bacterium]